MNYTHEQIIQEFLNNQTQQQASFIKFPEGTLLPNTTYVFSYNFVTGFNVSSSSVISVQTAGNEYISIQSLNGDNRMWYR